MPATTSTKKEVSFLPYGRQSISEADITAVNDLLRSDWLTCGPVGPQFEEALAQKVGAKQAVACANGTAALHLSMMALDIGPGDIVVTSPISFLASANCARYVGADILFADIDQTTGLISLESVAQLLKNDQNHKIKAIIPVHLAGQPAQMKELYDLAKAHGAYLVEDACHALGAIYQVDNQSHPVGACDHSDLTVFSFHPVKHIAMGEGGAISTGCDKLANRLRKLRSHGMTRDQFEQDDLALDANGEINPWYYEMPNLGYNYRLSDIQAALGLSQMSRLDQSLVRRSEIAKKYDNLIADRFDRAQLRPLKTLTNCTHAYHLYVLSIDFVSFDRSRAGLMRQLRDDKIGSQVHYIPIFLQPYYCQLLGDLRDQFPQAMKYYQNALSIPMYPQLTDSDCERVIDSLASYLEKG